MSNKEHRYETYLEWTGNKGRGTATYAGYERAHEVRVDGKPVLLGSSDPAFRGDRSRYNPEELLVASVSACHMLWYLHLAATNGVIVTAYTDRAEGFMQENPDGSGDFTRVILRPEVTISGGDAETALRLHHDVPGKCFIARSVKFPIDHEPVVRVAS